MQQKMGVFKAESNDGWEIVFKLLSPQTTEISLLSHSHSYFITLSPQKKEDILAHHQTAELCSLLQ